MFGEVAGAVKDTHRVRKLDHPPTEEERIVAVLAGECLQWCKDDELGHRWVCHTLPCPVDRKVG